eukprot:CAMPEP_0185014596 /NCGR_PEP_ID=MMETSP1098-20130426/99399_1 /TAXON_ID=89044 /ORGANISM="Spumella elongata, Strain CCAP 955/1" /LENGTH=327 /DNA_ID=CAMNT_0027543691 /DNA_START=53 /DNA_END=1036 /DNA_ORIENTATION=-
MLLESTGSELDVTGADTDWLLELGFDFSSDLFDSNEAAVDEPAKDTSNDYARTAQPGKVVKSCKSSTKLARSKVAKTQLFKGTRWLEKAERKASEAMLYAFPSFDRSDSLIFLTTSLCRHMNCGDMAATSRASEAMLYAFPSFDRSDSLIFLTTSLCRHMNCGDMAATSRLITSYFSKTCEIKLSYWDEPSIDVQFLLKLYQMLLEVHPDSIQVAQNIKVDGNTITASIFSKYTDNRTIHNAVCRATVAPTFSNAMKVGRAEEFRQIGISTTHEMKDYEQLVASQDDLRMYMHLEVEYVIDDMTKKVSKFTVNGKITAIEPILRSRD